MTKWRFVEPGFDEEPIYETLTEQEIFEKYWPFWYNELYKEKHKNNPNVIQLKTLPLALQRQACIDEYIVVNWGWKVE